MSMVKPEDVVMGGWSAAQTKKRYQGTPSSDRSMPNTSQATANSNGDSPWVMTAATVLRPLAAFFRTGSILPLVAGQGKGHHEGMFDVYCKGHEARVLLFPANIAALVNTSDGIEMHWRCTCGTVGVRTIQRPPAGRAIDTSVESAA